MQFLSNPKITYEDSTDGLMIAIPAPKFWPVLIFLAVWLCGWAAGEWAAISSLLESADDWAAAGFLMVWLIGWSIGGGFALIFFLFMALGKERILVRPDAIYVRKEVLGVGPTRRYDRMQIRELHVLPIPQGRDRRGMKSFGRIAFEYGEKTVTIGIVTKDDEANELANLLRGRLGL